MIGRVLVSDPANVRPLGRIVQLELDQLDPLLPTLDGPVAVGVKCNLLFDNNYGSWHFFEHVGIADELAKPIFHCWHEMKVLD